MKAVKPLKICNHKYNIFIMIFWVTYGHHILEYFGFLKVYFINFRLKLMNFIKRTPMNIEELECMKYTCYKIILITKFFNCIYISKLKLLVEFLVHFFVVNELETHLLSLRSFYLKKKLVENPFKNVLFAFLNNKGIIISYFKEKNHYHMKEKEIL